MYALSYPPSTLYSLSLPALPLRTTQLTPSFPQDPAAALALVSARSHDTSTSSTAAASNTAAAATASQEEADADLARAKELVKLHYQVKEAHKKGQLGRGLDEARGMVARAVGS